MYLFELWFSPEICPGEGLLAHMVALVFSGTFTLFSTVAAPTYIPSNSIEVPQKTKNTGHVHPWLIHVNVWQNPPQYCKVISLQLRSINFLKR